MFRNILVAVDGSEYSIKALNSALQLAEKFDGKITLVHVYSTAVPMTPTAEIISGMSTIPPASSLAAAQITEALKQKGNQILDSAEQVVKKSGISVEKVLREGDAVTEIVAVAKERQLDLIVLGHRGWRRLRELVLGAVSEGVGHKAPCSVLIVK